MDTQGQDQGQSQGRFFQTSVGEGTSFLKGIPESSQWLSCDDGSRKSHLSFASEGLTADAAGSVAPTCDIAMEFYKPGVLVFELL